METFRIKIKELLARVVEIEADNKSAAISKINELYKKEEIVLDYNDFVIVDFIDTNNQSENDEKNKLISEVIEHLYSDEENHFEESEEPENHIFLKLKRLKELSKF